jgi:hypothetical protein
MMGEIWIGQCAEKGNGKGLIYLAGCNQENFCSAVGNEAGHGCVYLPSRKHPDRRGAQAGNIL